MEGITEISSSDDGLSSGLLMAGISAGWISIDGWRRSGVRIGWYRGELFERTDGFTPEHESIFPRSMEFGA
jgi:hypothetical protein